MTVVGFHASHEQVHPRVLIEAVQAEAAGFTAAMSSDHFSPWSARQGHSGFAWSWLGAAMATTSLPFGVVNESVMVSSDPGRHAAWLADRVALGFEAIYLHHVGQEQREFIDVFGSKVLPQLVASTP